MKPRAFKRPHHVVLLLLRRRVVAVELLRRKELTTARPGRVGAGHEAVEFILVVVAQGQRDANLRIGRTTPHIAKREGARQVRNRNERLKRLIGGRGPANRRVRAGRSSTARERMGEPYRFFRRRRKGRALTP